jgi:hypothetical protein
MRTSPRRSPSVTLLPSSLSLIGLALVICALAPWITTHKLGGGTETIRGLAIGGWWVVALGVALVAGAAALWTVRSPAIGSVGVPVGVVLPLLIVEVRSWIVEVRGYLRVEGSAYGVSNPITRSVQHPIVSLHGGSAIQVNTVAGVLAICAGVLAALFSVVSFTRGATRREYGRIVVTS